MFSSEYKKFLKTKSALFCAYQMPATTSKALDQVMSLPHPQREAAFVLWAKRARAVMDEFRNLRAVQAQNN